MNELCNVLPVSLRTRGISALIYRSDVKKKKKRRGRFLATVIPRSSAVESTMSVRRDGKRNVCITVDIIVSIDLPLATTKHTLPHTAKHKHSQTFVRIHSKPTHFTFSCHTKEPRTIKRIPRRSYFQTKR